MDNNTNLDNDQADHNKDSSHDEIPLWLQGLAKRANNEETDKHNVDEWVKEISTPESLEESTENLIPDENNLEGSLPDWISELSIDSPEIEARGREDHTTDEIPIESTPEWEKEIFADREDLDERLKETTNQQGFVDISEISSIEEDNSISPLSEKSNDEEELPGWLKNMISEHGESLTGDTEPVAIHNSQSNTDVGKKPVKNDGPFPEPHEEPFHIIHTESFDDTIEDTDSLPEFLKSRAFSEDFDEIHVDDGIIEDDEEKAMIDESDSKTECDTSAEEREMHAEQQITKKIEEIPTEDEAIEKIHDLPIEKEPTLGSEEIQSDQKLSSGIENVLTEIEINAEKAKIQTEEQTAEDFMEIVDEDQSILSVEELSAEEDIRSELEDILPNENTFEDNIDDISGNWVFEEDQQEDKLQDETLLTSGDNSIEQVEPDGNIEDLISWEKAHQEVLSSDDESISSIEEDTVPTLTYELEPDEDEMVEIRTTPHYLPKVLEKAKQHLERGEISKGLEIITVYIEENAYLDTIQKWLLDLAKHPSNHSQRLWTCLGDVALKMGNPVEAYDNYAQAMKSLTQK